MMGRSGCSWRPPAVLIEQGGEVAALEQALLDSSAAECGLDDEPGRMTWSELIEQARDQLADDQYARNAFMLELAGVAAIGGGVNAPELIAYGEMGAGLGYSDEALTGFLDFASAAAQLLEEGRTLISTAPEARVG